jgi:hypothetical protein
MLRYTYIAYFVFLQMIEALKRAGVLQFTQDKHSTVSASVVTSDYH